MDPRGLFRALSFKDGFFKIDVLLVLGLSLLFVCAKASVSSELCLWVSLVLLDVSHHNKWKGMIIGVILRRFVASTKVDARGMLLRVLRLMLAGCY